MYKNSVTKTANNVLIVAITRMGDLLQSSPTIVGIKQENPNARITVVIEQQFANICTGIPGIDEVRVIDLSFLCRSIHQGEAGLIDGYKYIDDLVAELRERKFDLCLNMSNSAYTALLIKMLHIPECRGWLSDEEGFRLMADPWAMLFSAFVYHSNRDYNGLNLVDIFRAAAGVEKHPRTLQYRPEQKSEDFAHEFLERNAVREGSGPLICVQVGASQEKRQWSPERFARLSELLIKKLGARIVYTGAPNEQALINQVMERFSHPAAVSAAGKTSIDQLGAILAQADVLVTGDTGPMHLAVAVGTPVVSLFLASALVFETGPYGEGNFVIQPQISCNPCNPNYPCARPDCHDQISPELVALLTELRLRTPIGQEEHIRIAPDVADPRSVMIYRSTFDEDGFLKFLPMNDSWSRLGEPAGFFDIARETYRALWKEEFAEIPCQIPRQESLPSEIERLHPSLIGLQQALELCEQGKEKINELKRLVQTPSSPASRLGEVDRDLQQIDKKLEEVSLSYPLLGAIIRIFIMEKENLRGSDVLTLSEDTERLYQRLAQRSLRFGGLFHYFSAAEGSNPQVVQQERRA